MGLLTNLISMITTIMNDFNFMLILVSDIIYFSVHPYIYLLIIHIYLSSLFIGNLLCAILPLRWEFIQNHNHNANKSSSLSYLHDDYWNHHLYQSLQSLLIKDSDKMLATIIRCYGYIMAGLNPNTVDDATDDVAATDAVDATTTSTTTTIQKNNMMKNSQLECMIQFHTFIIDKYLLFSSFHTFSSINNNENNNDNNNNDLTIINTTTNTPSTTTSTSPLHTTPTSTTTTTRAINLSIDSIRSSLMSFQKLQYIIVTTSQKLLFAICFSYGYLVWNIFNYNSTFNNDSNNFYSNEKNLVVDINDDISHQQYQQIISLSLIEIMEILFYFFKYSKLKIKLQAVQILLFIVTKFIEINNSNNVDNNDDDNCGVSVNDTKDNNDDFDDKVIHFFFYSQEFFISFLLR